MTMTSDKVTGGPDDPHAEELARWMVEYGPALRRFFVRKSGVVAADDLVQEVFLRLQARADKTTPENVNVEGLLFAVAKSVLIDRYRFDLAHGAKLHDPIETAEDLADDLSPERILAAKQDYDRALVAVMDLPPRMRQAFVLHRFAKLSYSAIAKRMGIKKTSVQNLMERAIERFMENLEERK